jgi:hypothetical protein
MALVSKHYETMTAIRSAIIADADIIAQIPAARWRLQKKPWHRNQKWLAGAYICPLQRQKPAHENRMVKIIVPVLVSLVWPSDGALTTNQEAELEIIERIEQIFEFKGQSMAPAPLRLLGNGYTGANAYVFEQCYVTPGDQFVDGAFQDNFDALACVITVELEAVKTDESLLGA